MLTRKRNRKAIMVILIIIAAVFLFSTKVNAAEPVYDNIITDFYRLRADVNGTNGQLTYYNVITGSNGYAHCLLQPVFAGYHYQFYWNSGHALYFYYIDNVNNLDNYFYSADTSNFETNTLPLVALIPNTNDTFTYTCDKDGYILISNFRQDSSITDWNNFGLRCSTDYDGTSNLTSVHNDLSRIEALLRDYLYGDVKDYDVTNMKSINNKRFIGNLGEGNIVETQGWSLFYIPNKKGYSYDFSWSYGQYNSFVGDLRIGYANSLNTGDSVNTIFISDGTKNTSSFNFTSNSDMKYIVYCIVTSTNYYVHNVNITSNYNYGQEYGLYGGLTDINNQTKQQGEMTRDTITSTEYNQSDVNINTDSVSNIDTSQTDGLFTTIFNNFNSAATGGVDSISIPLPHNSGNIVLYSNVVSSHLGNLSALVSAFWYFVFGLYAFKFVNNLLHSIKDGSILNGFRNNNEVITSDML